jgi:hypothetical protein
MATLSLQRPKLERRIVMSGLAAGSAWGATVAVALLGLTLYRCGTVCLGQIVETTALSVAAGIVAIGPLVLFRRQDDSPAR